MVRIRAFQGLRPSLHLVEEVACVPYDVVDRDEAAALVQGRPNSLLHVDRAEIDLPPHIHPYSAPVYAKAQENFLALQQNGALIRESRPCVYLYKQRMGTHVQTGVAAVCHIDDYESNTIKKHEQTRPDKEEDRTRLIDALSANTGPVFLTFRSVPGMGALVAEAQIAKPLYNFTAPDGIHHTVWRITGGEAFVHHFRNVPVAYVADGHHRTASAVRVGRERRAANPQHTGEEDYNWFLAVLFPADGLRILPYHRVVKDLNGLSGDGFLAAVRSTIQMRADSSPGPTGPGEIRMYFDGGWFELAWQPVLDIDLITQLDVSVLQDRILTPILGIKDPRTDPRIAFVGGIRGEEELVRLVDSGEAAVAFSMYPATVEQLMAIADAGQIMPPKSTWFEPKLRSGLFIHTF